MATKTVLFLCTGNSCRSQMAEGWVNHRLGDSWRALSAGVQPTGHVHPLAVRVMQEIGIDLSHHRSQSVNEMREIPFDLVITVCSGAAENCPAWLGSGKVAHISFADPAEFQGTDRERLQEFRRVRDAIGSRILAFLEHYQMSGSLMAARSADDTVSG